MHAQIPVKDQRNIHSMCSIVDLYVLVNIAISYIGIIVQILNFLIS